MGGEEKKAGRGGGGGGGGGRAAAEEASVFPQERLCRAKSTWKSRGMGKWCREVSTSRSSQNPALAFTGIGSVWFRPAFGRINIGPAQNNKAQNYAVFVFIFFFGDEDVCFLAKT